MQVIKIMMFALVFIAGYTVSPCIEKFSKRFLNIFQFSLPGLQQKIANLLKLFKKHSKFEEQLPVALDFISGALKSGSSLLQGMDIAVRELPRPISEKLELVLKEIKMGIPLQDALENLARRLKNPDLDLAVTAISVSQETGGSLSEALEKISSVIRERNKILGKAKALVSQGKMQAAIVGILPVLLCAIILVIDPAFITPMFRNPLGWAMLGIAAGMEILGIIFIRRITKIEV